MQIFQPKRREFFKQASSLAGFAVVALARPAMAQNTNRPVVGAGGRSLPGELRAFSAGTAAWRLQGSGALRFLGFKAYDAHLWVAGAPVGPLTANPQATPTLFALEIVYNTTIKADEIVNVSLVEMARLRRLTPAQVNTWTADMGRTFPSVGANDRLTGVFVPNQGTRFFMNGRLISEINDPAFGDAFFAIWLDERTKRAELRRELLNLPSVVSAAPGAGG